MKEKNLLKNWEASYFVHLLSSLWLSLTQCFQLYLRGKTINFPQKKNQNNLLITILPFTIICFYVTTEPPCSLSSSSYIALNNTFIFSVISFFFYRILYQHKPFSYDYIIKLQNSFLIFSSWALFQLLNIFFLFLTCQSLLHLFLFNWTSLQLRFGSSKANILLNWESEELTFLWSITSIVFGFH